MKLPPSHKVITNGSFHNKKKMEKKKESGLLISKPKPTEVRDKAREGTGLSKAELKLMRCCRHPQDRDGQLRDWLKPGDASLKISNLPLSRNELLE